MTEQKTHTETVGLSVIRTDGGTQARAGLNEETVKEYLEAMREMSLDRNSQQFPPITLFYDGNRYWLADGFHRVEAKRRLMAETRRDGLMEAIIHQGTRRDAVLFAAGANSDHGLRRSSDDKRRAVETLLRDEEWGGWSDREIARRCKVSHPFVAKVRSETDTGNVSSMERTFVHPKTGKETVMNTANIGRVPVIDQIMTDVQAYEEEMEAMGRPNPQVFNAVRQLREMGYTVEATKAPEPLQWSIDGGDWLESDQVWAFLIEKFIRRWKERRPALPSASLTTPHPEPMKWLKQDMTAAGIAFTDKQVSEAIVNIYGEPDTYSYTDEIEQYVEQVDTHAARVAILKRETAIFATRAKLENMRLELRRLTMEHPGVDEVEEAVAAVRSTIDLVVAELRRSVRSNGKLAHDEEE